MRVDLLRTKAVVAVYCRITGSPPTHVHIGIAAWNPRADLSADTLELVDTATDHRYRVRLPETIPNPSYNLTLEIATDEH